MSQTETEHAVARIAAALDRIERASARPGTTDDSARRYNALRTRTQAALASLENVIERASGVR